MEFAPDSNSNSGDCKRDIVSWTNGAVNAIRKTTITRLQSIANRSLKSWLGLPRCSTLAVLYHPEILDVPYLPHMAEKAKTSHLSIVLSSTDPLVQETISLLQSPEFEFESGANSTHSS